MTDVSHDASKLIEENAGNLRWSAHLRGRDSARGFSTLARIFKATFGLAAGMAALSLWILPGSAVSVDLMAMKGAVTILLSMLCVVALQSSLSDVQPEIQVDFEKREVRVLDVDGIHEVVRCVYKFDELGEMRVEDQALHLFAEDGKRLALLELDAATEARLAA